MNLFESLGCDAPLCTAVVGAGGKSTTCFMLARQVPGAVWVTTTTHLGTDQTVHADRHFLLESLDDIHPDDWLKHKIALLTGEVTADDRLHSPAPHLLDAIRQAAADSGTALILEADGSRSIPLKAPGDHEPPIPPWVNLVIVVVGVSALEKPLNDQTVFRAARYAELTGLQLGEPITLESMRDMLLHPLGGLKNVPLSARKVVLLNQCDTQAQREVINPILPALLQGGYERVILAALKAHPEDCEKFSL